MSFDYEGSSFAADFDSLGEAKAYIKDGGASPEWQIFDCETRSIVYQAPI
jgi:hypothetical protein